METKKQRNHIKFDELLANIDMKLDLYIHGPTGSGKTQAISNAAKIIGLPFYKKVVGSSMSEASIMGYIMGDNYIPGVAYKPFTEGGVLLLDEVDNGNSNTNLIINGLSDGELAFPCGMREKHKDFILITTANTLGQGPTLNYIGRNKQDVALLNRFVFIFWPYDKQLTYDMCFDLLNDQDEGDFDTKLKRLNNLFVDVEKLTSVIEEMKIPHIISPRSMKQGAIKINSDRTAEEILNTVILKGLTLDQKKRILEASREKKSNLDNLPKFTKSKPKEENKPKSQEEKESPPKQEEKHEERSKQQDNMETDSIIPKKEVIPAKNTETEEAAKLTFLETFKGVEKISLAEKNQEDDSE